jgi:hypothetical protein
MLAGVHTEGDYLLILVALVLKSSENERSIWVCSSKPPP